MSDRPVTVIYHANCSDGFCAAWVLRMLYPAAEFVPASYGEPPPDVAGKRVVIADFSYKRPVMRQILSSAHSVTVLDHHKTAEAELAGIVDEFVQRPDLIAMAAPRTFCRQSDSPQRIPSTRGIGRTVAGRRRTGLHFRAARRAGQDGSQTLRVARTRSLF